MFVIFPLSLSFSFSFLFGCTVPCGCEADALPLETTPLSLPFLDR
jgi:hypothetical protein